MCVVQGHGLLLSQPEVRTEKQAAQIAFFSRPVVYWVVVVGSSALLLWGWWLAIQAVFAGKTVILG